MKMPDVLTKLLEKVQNPPIFVQPPTEKVVMTPARYARKTAFHIDPLLAESVKVENPLNPRCEEEIFGDDLWKHRVGGTHGRRAWKPLFAILLVIIATVVDRSSEQTFAAPASANVGKSDNGYHVQQVQYVLRSFGYSVRIDGDFGPQTERAVKHFQTVNGLQVDGIVGPKTLKALGLTFGSPVVSATPLLPASQGTSPPPPTPTLAPATPTEEGSVEQIIREVWPAHLADRAVAIAWRESRHQPGVRNACCFGLFQIYWSVHRGWLADLGITSSDQLFDARTNATAAYALYQRAGSWAPWAL